MKKTLLLFAIPYLILAACNSSADKGSKEKADSLAAVASHDSLMKAAKIMHIQDSIDAARKDDSAKKADSAKGRK